MRPISFNKRELGVLVMCMATSFASLATSDVLVFAPLLLVSCASACYLAYHHEGPVWRRLVFAVITIGLIAGIGYRHWSRSRIPLSAGELSATTVLNAQEGIIPKIEIGSSGVLFTSSIPGTEPRPEFLIGKIFIGAGEYSIGSLSPILDDSGTRVEVIDGQTKVSLLLLDSNGEPVAKLTRNEWDWGGRPVSFDRNYNQDSLEVQDKSGHIVLQVTVLKDRIRLQMVCHRKNGNMSYLVQINPHPTGARDALISFNNTAGDNLDEIIQPMFKYPSALHFGELVGH